MEQSIRVFNNAEQIAQYFATKITSLVSEIKEGNYLNVALSGGSTPKVVFNCISEEFGDRIDWKKVLIFWGDERCVYPESEDSNFRMAKESLLDHISIPSSNVFRIRGEMEPVSEAERYTEVVKQYVPAKNRIPVFDIFMLGLGDDGHTVSVFPSDTSLFTSHKFYEASQNPYTKQKRITATGTIINNAREAFFLVTGESKAEIVAAIINRKQGWDKLPASLVNPNHGKLTWLLDKPAACRLGHI